ncbi:hypothetical protein CHUAL_001488 [Chamberlinius hualienensis]
MMYRSSIDGFDNAIETIDVYVKEKIEVTVNYRFEADKMDLFDDLPEPVNRNSNAEERKAECLKRNSEDDDEKTSKRRRSTENERNSAAEDEGCAVEGGERRLKLRGCVAERKGERESMEDAHVIIDQYNSYVNDCTESAVSFYGVFDGHAGSKASNYAAAHLHLNFANVFNKMKEGSSTFSIEKEISKVFVEAFKKTDDDFLKEATKQKPAWKDGSTALTVVAVDDAIYIGNLGDSKAVLCRFNEETGRCVAIALSKDHNPVQYDERMRIQKMGGHVREGRVMGILEVSRSIGDGQYKTLGVTCIPDVKRCQLTTNDRYIIMACDGLWKVFSSESSIEFIEQILKPSANATKATACSKYETAAAKLSSEAVRRGSGDNVTVLIIQIQH